MRDIDAFAGEETENTSVASTEQSSFHIDSKTQENRFTMESHSKGIVGSMIKELASGSIPVLEEPATVKTKGRPVEARDKSSTRREPSAFKITTNWNRRCSNCDKEGHDVCNCSVASEKCSGQQVGEAAILDTF